MPQAAEEIEEQTKTVTRVPKPAHTYNGLTVASSTETMVLRVKHEEWHVTIETTDDPSATEWLKIRDHKLRGRVREIGILFSLSHPFTQRFGGTTPDQIQGLLRLAVGLAIAETTAREGGVSMAGQVRRHLNELLSGVLAQQ